MTSVETRPDADHVGGAIRVDHFVKGRVVEGGAVTHTSRDLGIDFATPEIDLDALITPRNEVAPLLDVPLAEIIDFLVATGERLTLDTNEHLQEALELIVATNPLPREIVANLFRRGNERLTREALVATMEANFSDLRELDGWIERVDAQGNRIELRAYPPRMIHMLAGNSPSGCISSIAQGAMVKAVNVFKMPSSDPFTAVAVLKTMADLDADHPVVKSMSAVYWRGGDERVERALYRPQYFDRLVAWGGGDAIDNVIKYLGPGLQLVSFDPKTSISMIGDGALDSDEKIDIAAELAAEDVAIFNQEACLASRFIFVEGDRSDVEKFCERLCERLAVERITTSEYAMPLDIDTREQIEMLQLMGDCEVWGRPDGRGLVLLTDEPVEFHPSNKTANVVHVESLESALRYVSVATQTIGMLPIERKRDLRDRLAAAGAQRIVVLGSAARHSQGGPHDAMFPLNRFVHWMADEYL